MLLVSVLAHPVESWCQPEIAKQSLAHQSLTGKILSRMDLVCSLRRPGRQVPTATTSPLPRRTESVAWHQGQMSDGRRIRGVSAVNFLGDKPSHGSARIPPDPQPQQSKIRPTFGFAMEKVVELRLTGQPGRRFPHECLSKPQFAEFMNLMRGNPRQSRQFAAADVCMAHWFHATDRAC